MILRSWSYGITRYQWLVLFIAWLGWVFDATDATIYAIVLHPAMHDLLQSPGEPVSSEQIGWYGGSSSPFFSSAGPSAGLFSARWRTNRRRIRIGFRCRLGLWGATNWAPTIIRELPDLKGSDAATLSASASYAIMALNGGALSGYRGLDR